MSRNCCSPYTSYTRLKVHRIRALRIRPFSASRSITRSLLMRPRKPPNSSSIPCRIQNGRILRPQFCLDLRYKRRHRVPLIYSKNKSYLSRQAQRLNWRIPTQRQSGLQSSVLRDKLFRQSSVLRDKLFRPWAGECHQPKKTRSLTSTRQKPEYRNSPGAQCPLVL